MTGTSFALFHLRRYDEGLEAAQKSIQCVVDAHTLVAFIANSVGAGQLADAQEAVSRLLSVEPHFRASHVHEAFPIRSSHERDRIANALREAGLAA